MSELKAGDRLPELRIPPISRTTLALFAGASGDHNPIHIDLDFAKASGVDDVFAHGMLSAAYLARLVTDNFDQSKVRSYSVRFTAITPIGAEPVCTGVVREVSEVDGERRAMIDLQVQLADGPTTLVGETTVALD